MDIIDWDVIRTIVIAVFVVVAGSSFLYALPSETYHWLFVLWICMGLFAYVIIPIRIYVETHPTLTLIVAGVTFIIINIISIATKKENN